MMNIQRLKWKQATIAIGVAVGILLITTVLVHQSRVEAGRLNSISAGVRSYLYRFDAAAQTFFTIPLSNGAVPNGVAVTGTNPTHVWIAEYGLNRITHVVFTNTTNYTQTAYPITSTAQSGPNRIAVAGNAVWFTERGANRVGRLNAVTGHLDEFYEHGLSPNAGLSDIKVAPDGTVWIGGQTVQRLIKLTVSSPSVYAFTEYTDTARPGFLVAPSFLAVEENDLIWLTVPNVNYFKVAQFTPSSQAFVWPTLPVGSLPMGVATSPGYAWLADISRNTIDQIEVATLTNANSYGPITRPMEIAAETTNVFWMTQDDGRGAIGRLIYTSTASSQLDSFAVPAPGLQLAGIAAASGSGVWFSAYAPSRLYLPLVLNNSRQ
jgi:streptogramin lyase